MFIELKNSNHAFHSHLVIICAIYSSNEWRIWLQKLMGQIPFFPNIISICPFLKPKNYTIYSGSNGKKKMFKYLIFKDIVFESFHQHIHRFCHEVKISVFLTRKWRCLWAWLFKIKIVSGIQNPQMFHNPQSDPLLRIAHTGSHDLNCEPSGSEGLPRGRD